MKIVGFAASPRKAGSAAWTVEQILAGAAARGAETEIFYAGALDIKPCRGCLACAEADGCAVNDDMRALYAALEGAGALVLGAPVYMGQMSGQAKVFTDRLFARISPRFSPHFKEENAGKKLLLAFTQGNPNPEMFREYFAYTEKMFALLTFDVRETVLVTGTRSAAASERPGLREKLRDAGAALVS
jgi:multimeric flavodoxin WrbA